MLFFIKRQALPGNRQTLVAMVISLSIRCPVALFTSFYTAIAHEDDDEDDEEEDDEDDEEEDEDDDDEDDDTVVDEVYFHDNYAQSLTLHSLL